MKKKELLKGPGYMQKMNEIYFDNPNQYKIKRFEIKRIKQIDKKRHCISLIKQTMK